MSSYDPLEHLKFQPPALTPLPYIKPVQRAIAEEQYASEFHERLVRIIQDFESDLDQEHEVGVRLVSFGTTLVFHLTDMGFFNPSLIRFVSLTDGGEPVELVQHVTQISVLLMRLPAIEPGEPNRIGFSTEDADSGT